MTTNTEFQIWYTYKPNVIPAELAHRFLNEDGSTPEYLEISALKSYEEAEEAMRNWCVISIYNYFIKEVVTLR